MKPEKSIEYEILVDSDSSKKQINEINKQLDELRGKCEKGITLNVTINRVEKSKKWWKFWE